MQHSDRMKILATTIHQQSGQGVYLTTSQLLQRHESLYAEAASPAARKKSIERDLQRLVEEERVERTSTRTPFTYRSCGARALVDANERAYALHVMRAVVRDTLPQRSFDHLWPALLKDGAGLPLGEDKLRIVSDTLRLIPADIHPEVLTQVLRALVEETPLRVLYHSAQGKRSEPLLHPQGMLQRGPRLYLYAVKDDDRAVVRMYAMHRMIQAASTEDVFHASPGFSLQERIDRGQADFASGERIVLCLRARGYVADLLCDSPLSDDQRVDDEPNGSPFDVHVRATVPSTGQLLRWLLGCGDNIELLEPSSLRTTVVQQSMKMAAIYGAETLDAI